MVSAGAILADSTPGIGQSLRVPRWRGWTMGSLGDLLDRF